MEQNQNFDSVQPGCDSGEHLPNGSVSSAKYRVFLNSKPAHPQGICANS